MSNKRRIKLGAEKLKKLLREKKVLERERRMDAQVMTDAVMNPSRFTVNPYRSPMAVNPVRVPIPEPQQVDPNQRPKSLLGYSLMDILLMESDKMLSAEEEKWLKQKRGRFDRYYQSSSHWMH